MPVPRRIRPMWPRNEHATTSGAAEPGRRRL
jgi:hypothetical protein